MSLVTIGRVWLVTPAQLTNVPKGIVYDVLSTNLIFPAPFLGYNTVVTQAGSDETALLQAGWIDAPAEYPDNQPVCPPGTLFDWVTSPGLVDPCAQFTDDDIRLSATIRGII